MKSNGSKNLNTFRKLWVIGIIAVIIVLCFGLIGKVLFANRIDIAPSNIKNTKELISSLEKAGYKTKTTQDGANGFLSGTLTTIYIDGDTIGVSEYHNNQKMEQEAKTIDGSRIGTSFYEFTSTPHFYKNGNIIVSYIGVNKKTIKTIEKLMGKQFEGM